MSDPNHRALLTAEHMIEEAFADIRIIACPKCGGEGKLRAALGMQCPGCRGSGKTTGTIERG